MKNAAGIIAGFHKTQGGRFTLESLTTITLETSRHDGKEYLSHSHYDVDYSRMYGYLYHMSGFGGGPVHPVSGIYFTSGEVQVKEEPAAYVNRTIRRINKTRKLKKLPKAFALQDGEDLFGWLTRNGIQDDAVWCSICRDYYPGEQLCQHCWWCDKTGWYSTPNERCQCKSRDQCNLDEVE